VLKRKNEISIPELPQLVAIENGRTFPDRRVGLDFASSVAIALWLYRRQGHFNWDAAAGPPQEESVGLGKARCLDSQCVGQGSICLAASVVAVSVVVAEYNSP